MTANQLIFFVAGVVAVSVGLLVWVAIDVGSGAMARYRANFTEKVQFRAQEFFLFIDPKQLFVFNLALMVLGALFVWMVFSTILMVIPFLIATFLLPRFLYRFMRKRRMQKFEEQLPDALMMLSGALRAGVGLNSAIAQLVAEAQAPLAQEFTLMLREQRLGVTLEQCLTNLNNRMPTPTTTLVVSAMRIAAEAGGGLAETLERTSHTIRSRLQMEGKIKALTAQGKLQAWVVGMLPIGLMLVLNKMEAESMSMLWHTRIGWATLAVIAILEIMGIFIIRKIIAIDV